MTLMSLLHYEGQRRSDCQLDMVGTKTVICAIAGKKGKVPVLPGVVGNEDIRNCVAEAEICPQIGRFQDF